MGGRCKPAPDLPNRRGVRYVGVPGACLQDGVIFMLQVHGLSSQEELPGQIASFTGIAPAAARDAGNEKWNDPKEKTLGLASPWFFVPDLRPWLIFGQSPVGLGPVPGSTVETVGSCVGLALSFHLQAVELSCLLRRGNSMLIIGS